MNSADNRLALSRAKDIAREALRGEIDLLVACRDLDRLMPQLITVLPTEVVDVFTAVASEVDGVPIGSERQYWSGAALKEKDAETSVFRANVKDSVRGALQAVIEASEVA